MKTHHADTGRTLFLLSYPGNLRRCPANWTTPPEGESGTRTRISGCLERDAVIETASQGWQPRAHPIYQSRELGADEAIRTPVLSLEDSGPTIGRHPHEPQLPLSKNILQKWSGCAELNCDLLVPGQGLDRPATPRKKQKAGTFRPGLENPYSNPGLWIIAGDVIHRWRDGPCPLRLRTRLSSFYH